MPGGHSNENNPRHSERQAVVNTGPGVLNTGSGPANAGHGTQYNSSDVHNHVGHIVNFYMWPPNFPPDMAHDDQSAYQNPPMGAFVVPPSTSFPAQYPQPQAGRDTFANLGHQQGYSSGGHFKANNATAGGNFPGTPNPFQGSKAPLTYMVSDAVVQKWKHLQTQDPEVDNIVNHVIHGVAPQVYYAKYAQIYQELIDRCNAEWLQGQAPGQHQQPQGQAEARTQEIVQSHKAVGNESKRGGTEKATIWHVNFINHIVEFAIRNGVEQGRHVKDIVCTIIQTIGSYNVGRPYPGSPDLFGPLLEVEALIQWCKVQKLDRGDAQALISSAAIQKGSQRAPGLPLNLLPQKLENENDSQRDSKRMQDRNHIAKVIKSHVRDRTKEGEELESIKDQLKKATKFQPGGPKNRNAAERLVQGPIQWALDQPYGRGGKDIRTLIKQEAFKLS
ncbi:uncharacterized protein BDZ99DRAFT_475279 [Mytilinidion resinicola]|uniref:Uncharacterized protein n=1 Tax=Mytilinidion resinicola TaxID=574789 RepID=A0A6A6YUW9_9PEZI|nr:uncharacterized protein BDZ99DRAFT_475279 [Mytilinidion resinicola]KAF2811765.1 hypothetical protein BDZ99DRAFT_475279 [Mytilinidion resinicola]